MTSKALTASDILTADDMTRERVEVPEWGGHLFIRMITAEERDAFEASCFEQRGRGRKRTTEFNQKNLRARLVVLTAVDADGNRLFSEDQVNALGLKSAAALDRCYEKAQELNKFSDDDIEALEGNSGAVRSDGST